MNCNSERVEKEVNDLMESRRSHRPSLAKHIASFGLYDTLRAAVDAKIMLGQTAHIGIAIGHLLGCGLRSSSHAASFMPVITRF